MTKADLWELTKTGVAIVYGVLLLLAAFGPLAQYKEWLALAAGIVSIIAGSLGVTLTKPTDQLKSMSARKVAAK